MKKYNLTPHQQKIMDALKLVPARLIEHKKKVNGLTVIMKDHKIVYIRPEDLPDPEAFSK